jgi:Flp pilus assembly pilin Flp
MRFLPGFVQDEDGQDVIEYALGVAFIALTSAAIFASAGSSTSGIWGQANNTLAGANASVQEGGGHHHHGGGGGFDVGGGGHHGHSGGE